MRDMVLVLNYDNFASRAVTRKLRSERIFCKVVPGNISLQDMRKGHFMPVTNPFSTE